MYGGTHLLCFRLLRFIVTITFNSHLRRNCSLYWFARFVRFNIFVTVCSWFPNSRQRVVSFMMESGTVKKKVEQRNTHDLAFSFMRGPEDAAGSRRGHGGDQTWNWRTEGQQTATAGYDGQGHTTTETNTRIHPLAGAKSFCTVTKLMPAATFTF